MYQHIIGTKRASLYSAQVPCNAFCSQTRDAYGAVPPEAHQLFASPACKELISKAIASALG
jgi:hypothetical protein